MGNIAEMGSPASRQHNANGPNAGKRGSYTRAAFILAVFFTFTISFPGTPATSSSLHRILINLFILDGQINHPEFIVLILVIADK
jgi:hypothetical protein